MAAATVLALASAILQALSNVIQHRAVTDRGRDSSLVALLPDRLWLLGFGLMVLSFPFQVVALGAGSVVVVQLVLVTMLVFTLPFAVLIGHATLAARDWAAALGVSAGLALFLGATAPEEGGATPGPGQWLLAGSVTLGICAVLILRGRRLPPGATAALTVGTAAGIVNGLVGPVTKGALDVLDADGPGALLTSGLFYATAVTALLGVLFPLWAFQVGPITASMPTITLANPVAATVLGVWLFGDRMNRTPGALALAAAGAALIVGGVVAISRADAVIESFDVT